MTAALFVLAAAAGTTLRWQLRIRLAPPYATLAVNLVGSFALGLLHGVEAPALTVLGVGGLGAMTTFSTFAQELVELWEDRTSVAVAYAVVTLSGGIAAALAGIRLA